MLPIFSVYARRRRRAIRGGKGQRQELHGENKFTGTSMVDTFYLGIREHSTDCRGNVKGLRKGAGRIEP